MIHLGPRAQAVLAPWLDGCAPDEFVFGPARSEAIRSRDRAHERKTPKYPSHVARNEAKRERRRLRARYDHRALAEAVRRACRKAGVIPFSPDSLRHLRAAEVRTTHGLKRARAVLGHSFQAMTDHSSASADADLAREVARAAG